MTDMYDTLLSDFSKTDALSYLGLFYLNLMTSLTTVLLYAFGSKNWSKWYEKFNQLEKDLTLDNKEGASPGVTEVLRTKRFC